MQKKFVKSISGFRQVTALLMLCTLTAGCASKHPRDPLEPVNRAIYHFNDKADKWVLVPVAEGYRDYTPSPVRTGVSNFFNNLGDANSALNYSLQGKGLSALRGFSCFVVNSTAGLLGLFELCSFDENDYKQTGLGDTFAVWGWKNSSYLVIPLFGPSTLRDGLGAVGNSSFRHSILYGDPHPDAALLSYAVDGVSTRAALLGLEETVDTAALDPYSYVRDAWLEMRAHQAGDTLPEEEEDDFSIDDLVY